MWHYFRCSVVPWSVTLFGPCRFLGCHNVLLCLFSPTTRTLTTLKQSPKNSPQTPASTLNPTVKLQEFDYQAPYRFVITDSLPKSVAESESLVIQRN